jgi:hypothetical protein
MVAPISCAFSFAASIAVPIFVNRLFSSLIRCSCQGFRIRRKRNQP